MELTELLVLAPADQVDWLSEALQVLEALSVSVEDADAQTDAEQALFGEPGMPAPRSAWQRSRVLALFDGPAAANEAVRLLALQDDFEGCACVSVSAVPEQDWVRLTQSQFAPVAITDSFWIVPTWHEPPAQAQQVIRLDPGLAFGTGTHPTTRMCLRWLAGGLAQQAGKAPELGRVLDYGCGSGILAIGAGLWGAASIDAVDIDEAAVQATLANAQANAVVLRAGLPALAQGTYQTVLANILATPLKVLAPLLCAHVSAGGSLVLAGILERQCDELQAAYSPYCRLEMADTQEGWVLMTARL